MTQSTHLPEKEECLATTGRLKHAVGLAGCVSISKKSDLQLPQLPPEEWVGTPRQEGPVPSDQGLHEDTERLNKLPRVCVCTLGTAGAALGPSPGRQVRSEGNTRKAGS